MKFIQYLCLLFLLLLTGCNENSIYNFKKVDDYIPVVLEEFGKDIYLYFSYETMDVYVDRENDIVEYRIFYPSNNENYLIRIKKANEYQDLTTDLNINWNVQNETTYGILSGVEGEGTIKLEYLDNTETSFKGEMWFDSTDSMMYCILSIGEYALDLDAKIIFNPGYFVDVDLNSYEEADNFLNTYGIENQTFQRDENESRVQVIREDENKISLYIGNEENYVYKIFHSNGHIFHWTKETNPETGNFIETQDFKEENHTYYKGEYTKDLLCIYSYFKDFDTGTVTETKYDLNGMLTYDFYEDERTFKEITYTEKGGTMKYQDKSDQNTYEVTFKKLNHNGVVRRHYLTIKCDYYTKNFTYVSEDSPILVKYECDHYVYNEHVIWTFNGKGNDVENMITCVRSYSGGTVTYTFDTVPWGTGMLYPPKNPGEFYF